MGWRFATTGDRETVTAMVTDAAEQASLRLTPGDITHTPQAFRRADQTSVFRPKASTIFTSEALLDAENRLLALARTTTGPRVATATVEAATTRRGDGIALSADQAEAIWAVATSGRVVDVLVGPAGAGKTTAMGALRAAWESEHGPGSVTGLAPSATAAAVLAEDLAVPCENTARWLAVHHHQGATFQTGQLVVMPVSSLAVGMVGVFMPRACGRGGV
jgi:ATP-dependent exoDNAse (exonuclease V) alpha subunit